MLTGSIEKLSRERPPAVVLGDMGIVRPLGMAGIPVILGSGRPHDETLCSRHVHGACVVPGWTGEHSASAAGALSRLGERLHDALGRKVPLMYGGDVHLDLIYRHRRELSEHYLFVLNDEDLAWALFDKERFYEVAAAAGIRVPATLCSGADVEAGILALREPIVVKPKRKADYGEMKRSLLGGAGKARVFQKRADLLSHPAFERHKGDVIVQEYIDCRVGDLVSFHGFSDETGRLLGSFCGRKSRTWPMSGGESASIELTNDADVHAAGCDVARKLGLKGPFKIDMIRHPSTRELFVLEVNARFNLWNYLGAVDGMNLPRMAYEHLVHGAAAPAGGVVTPRHRWVDLYRDYQAFKEQRARGEMSLAEWILSLCSHRNVHAVFAWDDPKPFGAWAMEVIRQRRENNGALRCGV